MIFTNLFYLNLLAKTIIIEGQFNFCAEEYCPGLNVMLSEVEASVIELPPQLRCSSLFAKEGQSSQSAVWGRADPAPTVALACSNSLRCASLTALLWGAKAPVVANNANFALSSQPTLIRVGGMRIAQ